MPPCIWMPSFATRTKASAQAKAASEAAQEAEAEAWFARRRAAEAEEQKIDPESGFI